ncbi:MAG: hypothetical protein J6V98_04170 [Bacteroidales bacterium]|nr:hypothetical protein [Bacteroidales bacterium]
MKHIHIVALAAVLVLGMAACQKEDNLPVPEEEPSVDEAVGFDENGASLALFSVAEGHTVRFSRGNLQHQPSTGLWRFAEKQYDTIGADNVAYLQYFGTNTNYNRWIDLFTFYIDGSGLVISTHRKNSDMPEDTNVVDWAWHNAIQNGGNKAYFWRTLTKDEWRYLLQERPNAVYKRGDATVDGVNGMVILPDEWTRPSSLAFNHGFHNYGSNVYTKEEWQLMQEAGAIFLPAEGCFNGENIYGPHEYGFYWTSTIVYYAQEQSYYTNHMCFSGRGVIDIRVHYCYLYGYAVRPVLDELQL